VPVYCVLLQLAEPLHDYTALMNEIERSTDDCVQLLEHVWIVRTWRSALELYDRFSPFICMNDKILVFTAGTTYYGQGFDTITRKWMSDNWQRPPEKRKGNL